MTWWGAALWGALGGVATEALDIIRAIKWHHELPWNVGSNRGDPPPQARPGDLGLPAPGPMAYCVAGVLRLLISGALTATVAATYPESASPLVLFILGLSAPTLVQQIFTLVPLVVRTAARADLPSPEKDMYEGELDAYLKHGEREIRKRDASGVRQVDESGRL